MFADCGSLALMRAAADKVRHVERLCTLRVGRDVCRCS
jgi:hypothetical protein